MIHLIAYISDYTGNPADTNSVASDIVATSKAANPPHEITGVLFFTRGKFLQVIEGPEAELRQLMRNIEADTRHTNVEYLIDTPVDRRGFQQWNMDFFNLDPLQKFDAARLKEITKSFESYILPRSDMLVLFYKALLEQRI